jgi:hypothetical protein
MSDTLVPDTDSQDPVVEPIGLAGDDQFNALADQLTAEFENRYPDAPEDPASEPVDDPAADLEDADDDPEPEVEVEAALPSVDTVAAELGLSVDDAVQVLRFAASLSPEQTEAWNASVNGSPSAPVAPPAGAPSAASGYGEPPTGPVSVGGTDSIPAQGDLPQEGNHHDQADPQHLAHCTCHRHGGLAGCTGADHRHRRR